MAKTRGSGSQGDGPKRPTSSAPKGDWAESGEMSGVDAHKSNYNMRKLDDHLTYLCLLILLIMWLSGCCRVR